jgi:predicted nucleic acid-binding protein
MKKPKSIVLDSWALIAYFEDEPAGEKVAEIIADSQDGGIPLLMSVVNVGEVWYTFARRHSIKDADEAIRDLHSLGIRFHEADWDLAKIAAAFKAKGRISYADCFAAALAKHNKATLITGDREFKQLEKEIDIAWL